MSTPIPARIHAAALAAWLLVVGLLAGAGGGYVAATHRATPTPHPATHRATPTLATPAAGKAGPAALYPDPALTPGEALPGVTAAQVCTPGYAAGARSVGAATKRQVYAAYGVANVPGQHEVDHFISLELGGSNAPANLWPEPYAPAPGAHEKDAAENHLHAEVCRGQLDLAEAQRIIADDWYAYYLAHVAGRP